MTTYRLPTGAKLRTTALQRYLVVAHYPGARPAVETSYPDADSATAKARWYAVCYPFTAYLVVDQHDGTVTTVHTPA